MSNFKVGDKVVRLDGTPTALFQKILGSKEYYIVTQSSNCGRWIQVDGVQHLGDAAPWGAINFKLYQEPEDDELPPAPTSALYYNSTCQVDNFQHMLVQPHWELDGHLSIAILKSGKKFDPLAYGDILSINLEPDAALQLAHDLRRMAMDIRRKEKASEV